MLVSTRLSSGCHRAAPSTSGSLGPTGPTGAQGATGTTGPAGISGVLSATVAVEERTTSSVYTDLATFGPFVLISVPASGRVLEMQAFRDSSARMSFMTLGESGDVSADDSRSLWVVSLDEEDFGLSSVTTWVQASATHLVAGLSPGAHSFIAKYRNALIGEAFFTHRSIIVIPLP